MTDIATGVGARAKPKLLNPIELLQASLRLVREGSPHVLLIWTAYALTYVAVELGANAAGVKIATPSLEPGFLTAQVILGIVNVIAVGLTLRLMLRGPVGWLRFDRPLLEGLGLIAIAQFISSAGSLGLVGAATDVDPTAAGIRAFVIGLGYMVAAFVMLKLMLWPMARIDSRGHIGPRAAWRLMSRTLRSYIGALLLVSIPLIIAMFVAMRLFAPATTGYQIVVGVASAGLAMFIQGVAVAIYIRRVRDAATVADVFD